MPGREGTGHIQGTVAAHGVQAAAEEPHPPRSPHTTATPPLGIPGSSGRSTGPGRPGSLHPDLPACPDLAPSPPTTPAPSQSLRVRCPRDSRTCSFPPCSLRCASPHRSVFGLLPGAWLNPPWSTVRTEHPAWWAHRAPCVHHRPPCCWLWIPRPETLPHPCPLPHTHPTAGSWCFSHHHRSNLPTGLLAASVSMFQSILDFKS